jgi:hypothetical protein
MSKSVIDDLGLGLLLLPVGLLVIVLIVGGLFLLVHDTADTLPARAHAVSTVPAITTG